MLDCIVIGAGPGGLVTTKELLEQGVSEVVCLEQARVDYYRYMNDMAGLIGCKPPLWEYFFLNIRLWRRIVFSSTQAIQFRLRGSGNKESLAREMMMKLPVGVPFAAFAALKRRLMDAFKALIRKFGPVGLKVPRNS